MMKKFIAGALSAVMCASALLSEAPYSSRQTVPETGDAPAAEQGLDSGVSGSNSFARYIQQQGAAQNHPSAKPLRAAAASEPVYEVTNLEFDRETGLVRVISSQTYAQKLVVTFTDEDDPSNCFRLEATAEAGEFVLTELTADLSVLPDFFTVSAQLINRLNQPACDAFTLKTYTHFVQEMQETDISEFEPEQVVNLDESADTNFFVLSEDTVQAESSETCNTLVSADYDQNIYVFDNIDDTVRSLEEGQLFFIRPTDADIISTQITGVEIDGDTATITGIDNIDDMFDFIKIEITGENQTYVTKPAEQPAPEDQSGAAAPSDEITHTSDRHYLAAAAASDDDDDDDSPFGDFEIELPLNEWLDPENTDDATKFSYSHEFSNHNNALSCELGIELSFKDQLNIYKRFLERDYMFTLETTASATVTGKLTKPDGKLDLDLLEEIKDEACEGVQFDDENEGKVIIPTPILRHIRNMFRTVSAGPGRCCAA